MTGVGPGCCVHAARLHDEDGCRVCGCPGGGGEFPEVRVLTGIARLITVDEAMLTGAAPVPLEAPVEPEPVVVHPYRCPSCPRTFPKPQGVGPHRRKAHGYRKPGRAGLGAGTAVVDGRRVPLEAVEAGYVGRHRAAVSA